MTLSVKENPRMKISRREKIIHPARKVTDVYIIFDFLSSHDYFEITGVEVVIDSAVAIYEMSEVRVILGMRSLKAARPLHPRSIYPKDAVLENCESLVKL